MPLSLDLEYFNQTLAQLGPSPLTAAPPVASEASLLVVETYLKLMTLF